jgi:putative SOS response-associated peptidase YedK
MCARYTLRTSAHDLQAHFDLAEEPGEVAPRFNVAPTDVMPIVRLRPDKEGRIIELSRWGLVPAWSKGGPQRGPLMINARSESAFDKPSFRFSIRQQRCLVPADGFFEWKHSSEVAELGGLFGEESSPKKPTKQPLHITFGEGLFAFAGIYDFNKEVGLSYTILTCEPNELLASIHDRMPVIVAREDYGRWLDPDLSEGGVRQMMAPADSEKMAYRPVNPKVGNVANDTPDMLVWPN